MSSPPFGAVSSYNQPHILHSSAVLVACGYDIDPRGVYTAVTEDVGEFGDVLFQPVKRAGEQMAQVVRKYLIRIHVRVLTQRLHLPPDIRTADRLAAAGDKDRTC